MKNLLQKLKSLFSKKQPSFINIPMGMNDIDFTKGTQTTVRYKKGKAITKVKKNVWVLAAMIGLASCGYKKECSFVLPENYKLVQDSATNKYLIWKDIHGYLYKGRFGLITTTYGGLIEPDMFTDSCEGKGMAKADIEQWEIKIVPKRK